MTFYEMWSQIKGLPIEAVWMVPETLSENTKQALAMLPPDEVAKIVSKAICEIDHGSVASLNELIGKQLNSDD